MGDYYLYCHSESFSLGLNCFVVRLIKLALLSFLIIFIIATLFSLLIPSNIRISKALNIGAPKDSVMALVKHRNRWVEWHPAYVPDDTIRSSFQTTNISTVSQTDSSVVMELQQGKKPAVINGWNVYEYESVDSITLQWYMDFHLKWYPWKKFGSLFYENTYGNMMQQGLERLKSRVERSPYATDRQP